MAVARGVHTVLVTPFRADETLDAASIGTLVGYAADAGVAGVLALGVLGEADRLSDRERERVEAEVVDAAAGRVQVTAGVTHAATAVAVERAAAAERAGADAVMASPPPGAESARAVVEHFRRLAGAVSIPVVVQDHPASSGVRLPVDLLAGLVEELPPGSAVKLEDPPTAAKIAELRRAAPGLSVFGGLGGVALLHELEAGAAGTLTGFALPHVLVGIVEAFAEGEQEAARRAFESALPLLVFEAQPVLGLSLRKEILCRRGAIATATVRSPAPRPDALTLAALDSLLARAPGGLAAAGGGSEP